MKLNTFDVEMTHLERWRNCKKKKMFKRGHAWVGKRIGTTKDVPEKEKSGRDVTRIHEWFSVDWHEDKLNVVQTNCLVFFHKLSTLIFSHQIISFWNKSRDKKIVINVTQTLIKWKLLFSSVANPAHVQKIMGLNLGQHTKCQKCKNQASFIVHVRTLLVRLLNVMLFHNK